VAGSLKETRYAEIGKTRTQATYHLRIELITVGGRGGWGRRRAAGGEAKKRLKEGKHAEVWAKARGRRLGGSGGPGSKFRRARPLVSFVENEGDSN